MQHMVTRTGRDDLAVDVERVERHAWLDLAGDQGPPDWLDAHSLVRFAPSWVALGRDLGTVLAARTTLEITRVGAEQAAACADIVTLAFGLARSARPLFASLGERRRWHVFAALDGKRPVAAAGLYLRGELAYVAFAATLPSHRRRGAQAALIERCQRVALALGARRAAATAPQHTLSNLQRAGFSPLYARRTWAPLEVWE
jgi:GNAT superfamily N-acetyltransferase